MPTLFIIAGCNGAGKTTAVNTILPEILNCREFVNADNIAFGLSPFNMESVALQAGRIMLSRIQELLDDGVDFAFETTLSTRSYKNLVVNAKKRNYNVTLIYLWVGSPETAIRRIEERVRNGGHNIKPEVVTRRYFRGLKNLFEIFIPICDSWIVVDNSYGDINTVAEGNSLFVKEIINTEIWHTIQKTLQ